MVVLGTLTGEGLMGETDDRRQGIQYSKGFVLGSRKCTLLLVMFASTFPPIFTIQPSPRLLNEKYMYAHGSGVAV